MGLVTIVIVGFLAGTAAKYLIPGDEGGGFVMTTLLGIGGAFVGSFLGGLVGISSSGIIGNVLTATAGAAVLIFAFNKFSKSSKK